MSCRIERTDTWSSTSKRPVAETLGALLLMALMMGSLMTASPVMAAVDGWGNQDIGLVQMEGGDFVQNGNAYTITASGWDIWGRFDEIHYAYKYLDGDGSLTARIVKMTNTGANWSKVGVDIRETLRAESKHAGLFKTPNASGNGVQFAYRTETNGNSAGPNTGGIYTPYWLRIERTGNEFVSWASEDGVNFWEVGRQTIEMNAGVYIGFTACAQSNTMLIDAIFDNVAFTGTVTAPPVIDPTPLPAGWMTTDIGNVELAGQTVYSGDTEGVFTVSGSGADIWGSADEFQFAYTYLVGDGEIVAKVDPLVWNANDWQKAGIMMRNELTAGSPYIMSRFTPIQDDDGWNKFGHQRRNWPNASSSSSSVPNDVADAVRGEALWFKITRTGHQYVVSATTDTAVWQPITTQTVYMNPGVYVGLAVTSHADGMLSDGVFSDVEVTGTIGAPAVEPTPLAPGWGSRDIGAVNAEGRAWGDPETTVNIMASGADIYGTADEFHFVYKKISGDASIAVMNDSCWHTDDSAKVGPMFRETLDAGSKYAATLRMPTQLDGDNKGTTFQARRETGGDTTTSRHAMIIDENGDIVTTSGSRPFFDLPQWLMLDRVGDDFISWIWDGESTTTTLLWDTDDSRSTTTVPMAEDVFVGLAVTSHRDGALAEAVFSNFIVTNASTSDVDPPTPTPDPTPAPDPTPLVDGWATRDIGPVGIAGYAYGGDASLTLGGSGADIWGTADQFRYVFKGLKGDGSITAKFADWNHPHDWAKAGLMIRSDLGAGAQHFMVSPRTPQTAGRGDELQVAWRLNVNGDSGWAGEGDKATTPPLYLRVERVGDHFTASWSADGVTFSEYRGAQNIMMGENVYLGMFSTSHDNGLVNWATFEDIAVTGDVSGNVAVTPPMVGSTLYMKDFGVVTVDDGPESITFRVGNIAGVGNDDLIVAGLDLSNLGPAFTVDNIMVNTSTADESILPVAMAPAWEDIATIDLTFDPSVGVGSYDGYITIFSDDPTLPELDILFSAAVKEQLPVAPETWGLELHLTPEMLQGKADGEPVALWQDTSVNGRNATQTNMGQQPVIVANALNGYPAVHFNGGSQNLVFPQVQGVRTAIVVVKEEEGTSANWRPILSNNTGSGGDAFHRGPDGAIFSNQWGWQEVYNGPTGLNGVPVTPWETKIPQGQYSIITVTTVGPSPEAIVVNEIGRDRTAGDRGWNGDYVEVMLFSRVLGQAELNELTNGLKNKYDLWPEGWASKDVGDPALEGEFGQIDGEYTLIGSGSDIWNNADGFRFAYAKVTGDCTIYGQLLTIEPGHDWAKAGFMMRPSLAGNSRHVAALKAPNINGATQVVWRSTDGAISDSDGPGGLITPLWLKLDRTGTTITAYQSKDGAEWTMIDTPKAMDLPEELYVGMVMTSHNNGILLESTFANVTIEGGTVDVPVPTPPEPTPFPTEGPEGWLSIPIGNATGAAWEVDWTYVDVTENDGETTASSQINANEAAWMAFDNKPSTKWLTAFTTQGAITYTFANDAQFAISAYSITSANDSPDRDPRDWQLLGSNDGSTWDVLDEQTGVDPWPRRFQRQIFELDAETAAYNMYRLDITLNNGSGNLVGFSEMELLAVDSNPAWVIETNSSDLWGASDNFHFVCQELAGDGIVTARVAYLDRTADWTKAGVMIRETLDANSKQASAILTASAGVDLQYRTEVGGGSSGLPNRPADVTGVTYPAWVSLEREGTSLTASYSYDGSTWVEYGEVAIDMTETVFAGFAYTTNNGHSFSGITEVTTVTITGATAPAATPIPEPTPIPVTPDPTPLAAGWASSDIGAVGAVGRAFGDETTMTVVGSGADIWGNADEFHYAYKAVTGDCSISVRLNSMTEVHDWAKAGPMIRETLAANSKHVMLSARTYRQSGGANSGLMQFFWRQDTGGGSASADVSAQPYPWYGKLDRVGDNFIASWSADGVSWTEGSSHTVTMNETVLIGLATLSHADGTLEFVEFSDIVVTGTSTSVPELQPAPQLTPGSIDFGTVNYMAGPQVITATLVNTNSILEVVDSVSIDNGLFSIDNVVLNGVETAPAFDLRGPRYDVVEITVSVDPFNLRPGVTAGTLTIGGVLTANVQIDIPAPADADGDGRIDDCESDDIMAIADPNSDETNIYLPDSDGDGLLDGQEDLMGCYQTTDTLALTHPRMADTDGDGFEDGIELLMGTDPLDPADPDTSNPLYADGDGDGVPFLFDFDDANPDVDGDGFSDGYEWAIGSDMNDANVVPPLADVNGDGSVNNVDAIMLFNMVLGFDVDLDPSVADVDRNGYINNLDAIVIFYWSLGNVPVLPLM